MKTRPELITRSGKSNVVLKKFLNNFRENDLHDENKITQCVFLGVLKLKPVPSMFSSNKLSSGRACSVDSGRQKVKKSSVRLPNKEYSKNINKVISGKISKKNLEKIKASVKKVPSKKSNIIKLKFNMNKKSVESSATNEHKSNKTNVPDFIENDSEDGRTNPKALVASTSMQFNPVQNLFDKLKRKIDSSHGSGYQRQEQIFLNSFVTDDARNKLILTGVNRKSKSPKNKSVGCDTGNVHTKISHFTHETPDKIRELFAENNPTKDIIMIDTDSSQYKPKERTSPRFRRISIMEGDKSKKYRNKASSSKSLYQNPNYESEEKTKNDIIVIDDDQDGLNVNDDVMFLGVTQHVQSSSVKKKGISYQDDDIIISEVICNTSKNVHEQESLSEIITVEETSSPKLKSRRNRLLPTQIPSIFLQSPRLLRSELSQKTLKKQQVEKPPKFKISSRLSKSEESSTPNRSFDTTSPKNSNKFPAFSPAASGSPKKSKKLRNNETIFVSEEIKSPNEGDKPSLKLIIRQKKKIDVNETEMNSRQSNEDIDVEETCVKSQKKGMSQRTIPKMYITQVGNDVTIIGKSIRKTSVATITENEAVNKLIQDLTDDDVFEIPFSTKKSAPSIPVSIIDVQTQTDFPKQDEQTDYSSEIISTVKEQQSQRTSRLLRSNKPVEENYLKQDLPENHSELKKIDIITIPDDIIETNVSTDIIVVSNESDDDLSNTPRSLRSNKQDSPIAESLPTKSKELTSEGTLHRNCKVDISDSEMKIKTPRLLRSNNKSANDMDVINTEKSSNIPDVIETDDLKSSNMISPKSTYVDDNKEDGNLRLLRSNKNAYPNDASLLHTGTAGNTYTENETTVKDRLTPSSSTSDKETPDSSSETQPPDKQRLLRSHNSTQVVKNEGGVSKDPNEQEEVLQEEITSEVTVKVDPKEEIVTNNVDPEDNISKSSNLRKPKKVQNKQKENILSTELFNKPNESSKQTDKTPNGKEMNNGEQISDNERSEVALQLEKKYVKKNAAKKYNKKVAVAIKTLKKGEQKTQRHLIMSNKKSKTSKRLMKKMPKIVKSKSAKITLSNKDSEIGDHNAPVPKINNDVEVQTDTNISARTRKAPTEQKVINEDKPANEQNTIQDESEEINLIGTKRNQVKKRPKKTLMGEEIPQQTTVVEPRDETIPDGQSFASKITKEKLNKNGKKIKNRVLEDNLDNIDKVLKTLGNAKVKKLKNAFQNARHTKKAISKLIQASKQNRLRNNLGEVLDSLQITEIVNSIQAIEISEHKKEAGTVKRQNVSRDSLKKASNVTESPPTLQKRRGRPRKSDSSNTKQEISVTQVIPEKPTIEDDETPLTKDVNTPPTQRKNKALKLTEKSNTLEATITKNRRGRSLKKSDLSKSSSEVVEKQEDIVVSTDIKQSVTFKATEENPLEQIPNKRKRPVKITQTPNEASLEKTVQEEENNAAITDLTYQNERLKSEKPDSTETTSISTKKRRGRPSKRDVNPDVQPENKSSDSVVQQKETSQERHGRSKNNQDSVTNFVQAAKNIETKDTSEVKAEISLIKTPSNMDETNLIPKKRRGRPSKLAELHGSSQEVSEQKQEEKISDTTETTLPHIPTVLKRGKGRPKKRPTSNVDAEEMNEVKTEEENQTETTTDITSQTDVVIEKRKGRSKKLEQSKDIEQVSPANDHTTTSEEKSDTSEAKETCWIDDVVPKKRKGRPKKLDSSNDKSGKNLDTKVLKRLHSQMSVTQLKTPVKQKLYEEIPKKISKLASSNPKDGTDSLSENTEVLIEDDSSNKKDITVFDFDEEESQEPVQFRGKSLVLSTDSKGKKQNKCAPRNSKTSSVTLESEESTSKISSPLKSPMKQPTIMEMFQKVVAKQKQNLNKPLFDDELPTKETPRLASRRASEAIADKAQMKPPSSRFSRQEEYDEDEDFSDDDSRAEWIPEEYAEYKFKYTAKKLKPLIYKCKVCLMVLPTYHRLLRHKQTHVNADNPYECKQCKDTFKTLDDLVAHIKIHKGEKPYVCKKCNEGFWKKEEYEKHIPIHILRKVKEAPKKYQCDLCGKAFVKLCDMDRHTRVHTGEKPCICNICGKGFQQSHNLSKHLITHLHIRPYTCDICSKQFSRPDVLSRHLLTHSVQKPFKCSLCPKNFIRQSQLNMHVKHEHSKNADDKNAKATTTAGQGKLSGGNHSNETTKKRVRKNVKVEKKSVENGTGNQVNNSK